MPSAPTGLSPESATARGPVTAAGAVVLGPGRRVLLVHRPKYDDWSFPKGKVDRGEHVSAAAVREVGEETGVRVRLGVPLGAQRYRVARGEKTVHYWVGRPVEEPDLAAFRPNAEVDAVAWLEPEQAAARLSYPHDRETLAEALAQRRKTRALLVVRHGAARSRRTWREDDRRRPLVAVGRAQAARLVPVLAAYDARRLLTSSSTRCVQTLEPYAAWSGRALRREDRLSEEDATAKRVARVVEDVLAGLADRPAAAGALALCTHRPVLPLVGQALGLPDLHLETAEVLVAHLRGGAVVATERHRTGRAEVTQA